MSPFLVHLIMQHNCVARLVSRKSPLWPCGNLTIIRFSLQGRVKIHGSGKDDQRLQAADGNPSCFGELYNLGVGDAVPRREGNASEPLHGNLSDEVLASVCVVTFKPSSLSLLTSLPMQKGLVGLYCNWSKYLLNVC